MSLLEKLGQKLRFYSISRPSSKHVWSFHLDQDAVSRLENYLKKYGECLLDICVERGEGDCLKTGRYSGNKSFHRIYSGPVDLGLQHPLRLLIYLVENVTILMRFDNWTDKQDNFYPHIDAYSVDKRNLDTVVEDLQKTIQAKE